MQSLEVLILHLDQHKLGLRDATDGPITFERRAARGVLFNDAGKVAVMHFTATGSYKLPGGGIDEGEEIIAALHREIREETGYEISAISELGVVTENRFYCAMSQTSYCFSARVGEFVGTELTEQEAAGGMELQWFDTIEQAIAAVESSSKTDEEGSQVGLQMMILRDTAILQAARAR